jgi:hypothetical protein
MLESIVPQIPLERSGRGSIRPRMNEYGVLHDEMNKSKNNAGKKRPKNASKNKGKPITKAGTPSENTRNLTHANINLFVNSINEGVPDIYIPTADVIRGGDILRIYRRALVPCLRSIRHDRFIHRAAYELDPDPFNNRSADIQSLWLTGSTILKYISVLKDDSVEADGPSLYNMGPYCSNYRIRISTIVAHSLILHKAPSVRAPLQD